MKLRKKWRDYFAKCPFHNEKSASFSVVSQKQFYHCFGCGCHGNAIDFLMVFTRKGFVEVVQMLAKEAWMKRLKYGNIYAFEWEPWEIIAQTESEIRRILDLQDNDHYFHYLRDLRWKVNKYRKIISVLMQHSGEKYSQVYGKSLAGALWCEIEDEFGEWNMEIHPFSDIDSDETDDLVAGLLEADDYFADSYFEDWLDEFYGKSLTEVLGDFEELEIDNITTTPNDTTELNHFNFGWLDDDWNWREGDSWVHQEEMAEEQIKLAEELRIAREENPHKLLLDLGRYKEELKVFSQERDTFFEACEYVCVGEKENESLSIGDFGKLVLVYQKESQKFFVVIGSSKSQSAPPESIEAAKSKTRTDNMPSDVGIHEDISIPDWSERFWWAQYIVLPENTILIGGQSDDYGSVPREIVEKCFESLGYSVFFLDNTQYGSIDSVYRSVRNK